MLDPRILTFLELCSTKSFTKTADLLHITQPAVSQQIKSLEEQYGVKLYQYLNRHFDLTNAGERLYHYAQAAKIDSDLLRQSLRRYSVSTEPLRIGAEDSAGESFLPRALTSFFLDNASVQSTLTVANVAELQKMMQRGEIDYAISDQIFPGVSYDSTPLFQTDVVCICGPEHPLANKVVDIQELLSQTLILRPAGYPAHYGLNTCLQSYNCSIYRFQALLEINSYAASKIILHQNVGIGFFYRCLVRQDLKTSYLSEIHLSTKPMFENIYTYYLVSKHNLFPSEAQRKFAEYCETQFLQDM